MFYIYMKLSRARMDILSTSIGGTNGYTQYILPKVA